MLGKEHLGGVAVHPVLYPTGLPSAADQRKTRSIKKESAGGTVDKKNDSAAGGGGIDANNQASDPMKDEPGDFIETNCHWKECLLEFNTQEELVKVT